jgi:hypothetical protein
MRKVSTKILFHSFLGWEGSLFNFAVLLDGVLNNLDTPCLLKFYNIKISYALLNCSTVLSANRSK